MALHLRFLGPPVVQRDGQELGLDLAAPLALLAYLAATALPQRHDVLGALLWPQQEPDAAEALVHQSLERLRDVLGDGYLLEEPQHVAFALRPGDQFDVSDFHVALARAAAHQHPAPQLCPVCVSALTAAVELYRGPFLDAFSLPDAPEFALWQSAEREVLHEAWTGALEKLVGYHLARKDSTAGLELVTRWLALEPLDDDAHRWAMELHVAAGDASRALKQYEDYVRELQGAGALPSPDTTSLYQALAAAQLGSPAASPLVRSVAQREERFVRHELLASGGQADVFLGHDRLTGQPVAIKRLKADRDASDTESVQRFEREGELLRRLAHPNIVNILGTYTRDGRREIVMEYAPGGSLRQLLEDARTLPVDYTLDIALEMADALARAHHLGVVHRDIKPENVLLGDDAAPRLSDFGLGHLLREDVRLTASDSFVGSPGYMSPETLLGGEPDVRSDIWSFGVMLYELLAGERPFAGERVTAVIVRILNEEAPPLQAKRPDVPAALSELVRRMLAKDPADRPASMRQVAADLETIRDRLAGRERGSTATSSLPSMASASGAARQHNLPTQPTPLIGRAEEFADLRRLLVEDRQTRLLTIVGPGGTGKTRLALSVAEAALDHFRDGVYFVPLAPLQTAQHMVSAMVDRLPFRCNGSEDTRRQLLNFLRHKEMLLVLDNFEHLLDGAALVAEILSLAPGVKVLATSRERLNLRVETVYFLGGLTYPPDGTAAGADGFEAPALLIQRAQMVRPGLEVRPEDGPHIARITRLVQGMPLALVLAGGWLEILSFEQVADEITRGIDFLQTDMRDVPERQRSVRAVFDSSWRLLQEQEQEGFARLSVFRGGFSREAAAEIAGAQLRMLRAFVNKSLVNVNESGRYQVHELLRQFAAEKLATLGMTDPTREAHSSYFCRFLHQREADLKGRRQVAALQEVEEEMENVRAAWRWALQQRNAVDIDLAVEGLHLFSDMRGRHREGARLLNQAKHYLAPPDGAPVPLAYGRILVRLSFLRLMFNPGNAELIRDDLLRGLAAAREAGDRLEMGLALAALGNLATTVDADPARALEYLAESQVHFEALGDPFYLGHTFSWQAISHAELPGSGVTRFIDLMNEALRMARVSGSEMDMAVALANLAEGAFGTGEYDQAERYCQEAIAIGEEVGLPVPVAHCRVLLGLGHFLRGALDDADRLVEQGTTIASEISFAGSVAYGLAMAALLDAVNGDHAPARQQAAESLSIPANNSIGVILAHTAQAIAASDAGQETRAWSALRAAVENAQIFGSPAILTWLLPVAAVLHARRGQLERATALTALVAGHPLAPQGWTIQWPAYRGLRQSLLQQLGEEAFAAAWTSGAQLDLDGVAECLLEKGP